MKKLFESDKVLITTFGLLLIIGLLFFLSASLGVLASNGAKFNSIIQNQLLFGFLGSIISFIIIIRIPTTFWQKYASLLFFISLILTALVYIPGIGISHGGAVRWIDIGPVSFQPSDFLKAGVLLYLSALYSKFLNKNNIQNNKLKPINIFSLIAPAVIILGLCSLVLLFQPDTKSVVLIFLMVSVILFIVGLPYKIIISILGILIIVTTMLIMSKPYIKDRFETFLNPERDPRGSSYQLKQSLIGFGSGGLIGQGFGQSVQKFNFLPEPQGDSIFAVVGEEVGFIGSIVIIGLYLIFILRGIKLVSTLESPFGRLFFVGFFTLFAFQTFLNIGSITGLIPLTGVTLPLMSQGGTSLLITCSLFAIVVRLLYEQNKLHN
ncbi:hypothetical protein A3C57_01095 [Candidatus Nomurabacteria bacterium RIFCSPHIGHO2_02_FULL_33_12]|uniref:Probable peptidoglycan glycosyltransferase FtsW n=1 Tax=Candidatus Nomurabacteria bacterium RIFCSPLOWO2_01_FULL_33_17 TaxID=1801764 RepID=A0A1F6WQX7_9BACT|nr:MAG: hypothetical protein A3C57_01095 [Candidatus Nomurabacteria bacterium RIFCSPHIGHO2_02_FULL_33_12]OGI84214.1 MAG: hypothetical protein A2903_00695 [Candidatus Nomurabacteria bacterium RIFCSPLOWO2_01_FULL_33_17]